MRELWDHMVLPRSMLHSAWVCGCCLMEKTLRVQARNRVIRAEEWQVEGSEEMQGLCPK